MKKKDYNIVFSSLSLGHHTFEYEVDSKFLEVLFDYHELPGLEAQIKIDLMKQNTMLEFSFAMKGKLPVHCDISGKPYLQDLTNQFELVVKFGEAYNDDDDEILILPQGEYEINVAQFIYELIVLSLPSKYLHPDVLAGDVDDETLALLDKYMPGSDEQKDEKDDEIDPRWSKLKDLLN